MTPEVSRFAAAVKERLRLEPDDPRMEELIEKAELATDVNQLPNWALKAGESKTLAFVETKDRVRTPEGARQYGQPIGSEIIRDKPHVGHLLDKYDGTRGEDNDAENNDRDTWTSEQWDEYYKDHYDDEDMLIDDWIPPWSEYLQGVRARERGLDADIAKIVDGTYGNGFEARVTTTNETPKHGLAWEVEFTAPDGGSAGGAKRYFMRDKDGNSYVYNDSLDVNEEYRRQGLATDFTSKMDDYYRASGVKYERLFAGASHGGLVWALRGYDFLDPEDMGNVPERLDLWLHKHPGHDQAAAAAALLDKIHAGEYVPAAEIATLGYTKGTDTWPGAEIMKGSEWHAIKWL